MTEEAYLHDGRRLLIGVAGALGLYLGLSILAIGVSSVDMVSNSSGGGSSSSGGGSGIGNADRKKNQEDKI